MICYLPKKEYHKDYKYSQFKIYVPGLKPSSFSEKEKEADKRIIKVPRSGKDTKSPATKEPAKKTSSEHEHDSDHSSVSPCD